MNRSNWQLVLFVTFIAAMCGCSALAEVWECDSGAYDGILPWANDASKGTAANPLSIKVVCVRFPDTDEGGQVFSPSHQEIFDSLEILFREQSGGAHNLDYTFVKAPSDTTRLWGASHLSGEYGSPTSVGTFAEFENCWEDSLAWRGELQAEIFATIQADFDTTYGIGGWTSPFDGADAIAFIYCPSGTQADNPIGSNYGGIGGLDLKTDCDDPRLNTVLAGAPRDDSNVLVGHTVVAWNPSGQVNNTIAYVAHEWGHVLGLDHSGMFGAYSVMRPKYESWGVPKYVLFSQPQRVRLGWATETVVDTDQNEYFLEDIKIGKEVIRLPINSYEGAERDSLNWIHDQDFEFEEYFLIAYESPNYSLGYGAPDFGLSVWHVVETTAEYL